MMPCGEILNWSRLTKVLIMSIPSCREDESPDTTFQSPGPPSVRRRHKDSPGESRRIYHGARRSARSAGAPAITNDGDANDSAEARRSMRMPAEQHAGTGDHNR